MIVEKFHELYSSVEINCKRLYTEVSPSINSYAQIKNEDQCVDENIDHDGIEESDFGQESVDDVSFDNAEETSSDDGKH